MDAEAEGSPGGQVKALGRKGFSQAEHADANLCPLFGVSAVLEDRFEQFG